MKDDWEAELNAELTALEVENKKLKKRCEKLQEALYRTDISCKTLHHQPDEYHEVGKDCPVEDWINELLEER